MLSLKIVIKACLCKTVINTAKVVYVFVCVSLCVYVCVFMCVCVSVSVLFLWWCGGVFVVVSLKIVIKDCPKFR